MHSQGSVALTVTLQSHSIFLGYFLFFFIFGSLRLYSPWNSLGQNTGVGSLFLLQGIFPT